MTIKSVASASTNPGQISSALFEPRRESAIISALSRLLAFGEGGNRTGEEANFAADLLHSGFPAGSLIGE